MAHLLRTRALAGFALAVALFGACDNEAGKKKTSPPPVPGATFKLRLDQSFGLEETVLTIDGKVVGKGKGKGKGKGNKFIDVDIPNGVMLSEKKDLVSLRADTTCGIADMPLKASDLDAKEEAVCGEAIKAHSSA